MSQLIEKGIAMNEKGTNIFDNMKLGTMIRLVSSKGRKKERRIISFEYLNGVQNQLFFSCIKEATDWFFCGSGFYEGKTLVKLMEAEPYISFLLNGSEGATNGPQEANNIIRNVYQFFDTTILRSIKATDVNRLLNVDPFPNSSCHVFGRYEELLRDGSKVQPGRSIKNTAYSYSYRNARCNKEVLDAVFSKAPYMLASTSNYAIPQFVNYCIGEVSKDGKVNMNRMLFNSNGCTLREPLETRLRAIAYINPDDFDKIKLNSGMYMLVPKIL